MWGEQFSDSDLTVKSVIHLLSIVGIWVCIGSSTDGTIEYDNSNGIV